MELYRNTESRDEGAGLVARELSQARRDDPQLLPDDLPHTLTVDTAKLSTVAHAIHAFHLLELYTSVRRVASQSIIIRHTE